MLGPPGSGRASSRCAVRTEGTSSEESWAVQVWTESETGFQPRRQSAERLCTALHLFFCHVDGHHMFYGMEVVLRPLLVQKCADSV